MAATLPAVVAVQSPAPGPTRGKEAPRARSGGLRVRSGVLARQGRATARGRYLQHASPARPGRVDECVVQVKENRADPTQPHSPGNPSSVRSRLCRAAHAQGGQEHLGGVSGSPDSSKAPGSPWQDRARFGHYKFYRVRVHGMSVIMASCCMWVDGLLR